MRGSDRRQLPEAAGPAPDVRQDSEGLCQRSGGRDMASNPIHIDTEIIRRMLDEGWTVEGYSTVIMAAGAMTHSILLRKGNELVSANTTISAGWTGATTTTNLLAFFPKRKA